MSADDLQFQTAEVPDDRKKCSFCQQPVGETFYQVQGFDACPSCAESRIAGQNLPDPGFLRPFAYGSAAALGGLIAWSTISIMTGWEIGIIAIGVGWGVGTAIRKGTNGYTAKKYQILAVLLTYLAISGSFLPRLVAHMNGSEGKAQMESQQKKEAEEKKAEKTAPAVSEAPQQAGFGAAIAMLIGMTLVSPFLGAIYEFPGGMISLLILFFALQQAWKMTQPDDAVITGPFRVEEPAA